MLATFLNTFLKKLCSLFDRIDASLTVTSVWFSMLQLSVYLWYIYKRSLFSLFVGKTDVVLPEGLKERERREVMLCTIIIW